LVAANNAATVETTLPARVVSLSRTESVLVSPLMPPSSSLPLDRRALPISVATAEAPRPTNNLERTQLPIKSFTQPTLVCLAEEATVLLPKSSSDETNVLAPSATLSRGETRGPQPTLSATANGLATTRAELRSLRTTSRFEAAAIANLTAKTTTVPLLRRELLVSATVSIAAVDVVSGMGTATPGILLTSTTMLVELLRSAPLPAVPRADFGSPGATTPVPPFPQLVPQLASAWTATNGLPEATEPPLVILKPSLPRRVRESVPAELIETISTTP
jgi:hypothetical protein